MAKAKAKASKKRRKGKELPPEMVEIRKLEATRKRLLSTVMDARDKKECHTNKAASLAAQRQEEMKEANRWEKIETEAIEDVLKLDGGQFIDRLPFPATDSPQSVAGKVAASAESQASPTVPTLAQREKELESITLKDLGIVGKLAEKIESDGITNGAKLRVWLNEAFPRKIAGVGDNAKDKLGDALNAWWMNHPFTDGNAISTIPPKAPADKDAPLTKTTPEPVADQVRDADAVDVINLKGKLILQIAPRRNENFAYGFLLKIDKDHEFEQPWFGHYEAALRDKCYRDALDAVTTKLHEWEAGTLPLPAIQAAKEVHGAIIDAGKLIGKRSKKAAAEPGDLAATMA